MKGCFTIKASLLRICPSFFFVSSDLCFDSILAYITLLSYITLAHGHKAFATMRLETMVAGSLNKRSRTGQA